MGSATSKTARKLPKSTPSWSGGRAPSASQTVQPPHKIQPTKADATFGSSPSEAQPDGNASTRAFSRPAGISSRDQAQFDYGERERTRGRSRAVGDRSSERKDEAIQQDAGVDPDFLAKLSQLGQVVVPKAGTSYERSAPAHQTMLSRNSNPSLTSTSSAPPPRYLTSDLLSNLLDRLKVLPPQTSPSSLYKEYGVDEQRMEVLRRWVNSPSVDRDRTKVVIDENGEQSVKMTAIWADNTHVPEAQKAIGGGKTTV